jgi:hypothetical protein
MQYALLVYSSPTNQEAARPMDPAIAEVLATPTVTGWARLYADESATTVRGDGGSALLTDGPFVESKEFLAGLIMVEAGDLDEALAIARELRQIMTGGAIEVRPVREWLFRGA